MKRIKKYLSVIKPLIYLFPIGFLIIIGLAFMNLIFNIILGLISGEITFDMDMLSDSSNIGLILIYFILTAIYLTWYTSSKKNDRSIVNTKRITFQGIWLIMLLGLGDLLFSLGILNVFLDFISIYLPGVVSDYNNIKSYIHGGSLITIILRVAILAPVLEELIFRGLILKRATKIMPFYAANILQALLFALFHMNVIQFTYAFPAGLLYGYVTLKYRSLIPSIYLHMFNNAVSILISNYNKTAVNPINNTIWFNITITIVGGVLLYTCYCMMKRGRYVRDVSANSEVSTREVLVNYTNHSDLIECPDYIVEDLAYYQEEFDKLALINNCFVSLETFIEWVNKTHLKDRDEKINIVKRGILPTEEQGKLPQLYY